MHGKLRPALIWAIVLLAGLGPLVIAAQSPLLAWRQGIYILAGFAGILGLGLLLLQPLLAAGLMPGLAAPRWRWVHRLGGIALTCCIALHVIGFWEEDIPGNISLAEGNWAGIEPDAASDPKADIAALRTW